MEKIKELADGIGYIIYCPVTLLRAKGNAINKYSGSTNLSDSPRQIRTQAEVRGRGDERRLLLGWGNWL